MPTNTPLPFLVPPPLIILKVGGSFEIIRKGKLIHMKMESELQFILASRSSVFPSETVSIERY